MVDILTFWKLTLLIELVFQAESEERGNMFDQEAWEKNEWIESEVIECHFNMTFSECIKEFGFNRQAEWNKPPLNGQKITTYFRKYK